MIFNSILYVQLEGFAALVLFIIMDHGKNRLMNLSQRLFKLQLCLTIAVLLLDAATWVLNGRIFPGAHTICLAVNQLYWFLSILPCYVGFLYCVSMICGRVDRLWGLLAAVPVAVGALFLILNFQNGWIFTVSDTNVYTRGPYFLIVGSMPFLHMAAAVVLSAVRYFRAQIYERKLYIMLMFFMLFPLVGSHSPGFVVRARDHLDRAHALDAHVLRLHPERHPRDRRAHGAQQPLALRRLFRLAVGKPARAGRDLSHGAGHRPVQEHQRRLRPRRGRSGAHPRLERAEGRDGRTQGLPRAHRGRRVRDPAHAQRGAGRRRARAADPPAARPEQHRVRLALPAVGQHRLFVSAGGRQLLPHAVLPGPIRRCTGRKACRER
jgi:hypothetical protein